MSKSATAGHVCVSETEAECEPGSVGLVQEPTPAGYAPEPRPTILRNFAALASAQTAERLVSFFGAIYVRRVLAVATIGQVAWTASLVSYFSLIVSPGFQTVAKRDVARDPQRAAEYASLLLSLQLLLALAAYAIVFGFSRAGLRAPQLSSLLLLQGITLFIAPFDMSWLLYARERIRAFSVLSMACAAMQTACLFAFVRHPRDVYRYVLLPLLFRFLLATFAVCYASRRGLLDLRRVRFRLRGSGPFLKASLPIGLSMTTVLLYYNFDNVLLGFLRGDHAVGIYSTAYSLMLVPTFLNTAMFNAYFPQLARVANHAFEAGRISAEVLRRMTWIGCSLAFLGWATGRQAVTLIFGASYLESGRIFEWLCLDLVLVFFNMAYNQPLVAWNHQRLALRCTTVGAVVNVVLNFLLIPAFGSMGAVVSTILAEVAVLFATVVIRRNIHPIDWWKPLLSIGTLCMLTGSLVKALTLAAGVSLFPALALAGVALTGGFIVIERDGGHLAWDRLRRA